MAANVIRHDHELYLKIGMNDIITKPLEAEFATIRKWLKQDGVILSGGPAVQDAEGSRLPMLASIDVRKALGRLNGRTPILRQMIRTFGRDYYDFSLRLRRALEQGDLANACRMADTLKGAAGNLSAHKLYTAAARIESILRDGKTSDGSGIGLAMNELERCMDELLSEVKVIERQG